MPLYALLEYARARANSLAVDCYGVALLKRELFAAGARPVIYGLTGRHLESGGERWPRYLSESCGLAENEQYRYVSMNLSGATPIDWSHEREWRWADAEDKFDCPGLPIWLQNEFVSFSTVILIVRTRIEAERVLDKLKLMRDSKSDDYCNPYALEAITRTRVLAVDEAISHADKLIDQSLRIEDIPVHELREAVAPVPSEGLISRVARALDQAKRIAEESAKQWRDHNGRNDVHGFAYLMVVGPRTEVIEAMLTLNELNTIAMSDGFGYRLANIGGSYETHLLGEAESAVEAAQKLLEQELPGTQFYVRSVWD